MKKLFALAALFALVFTACDQPLSEIISELESQSLTIRNLSSFDLTDVKFSGVSFEISNSNELPSSAQSTKQVTANVANQVGYITFTRKDKDNEENDIPLRTYRSISFADYGYVFHITDDTLVQEQTNNSNQNTLAAISFLSKAAVEHGGLAVAKYETIYLGESVINNVKTNDFIIKNTEVGKLILGGNQPVKIDGEPGIFTVVQPANSVIASNDHLPFGINFNPREGKTYTATVTISSNDRDGDFVFTVSAVGVTPKPIISIHYDEIELSSNGTINAGDVLITQSKNIPVIIKNDGTEVLTINTAGITITGTDTAAFTKLTNPSISISAGNQSSFIIECKPFKEGVNQAILSIPNNDSSHDPAVIFLTVTGVKGHAVPEVRQDTVPIGNNSVTPLDFRQVEVGTYKPLTFTLKNTGNITLQLIGNPLIESTNSAFTITTQPVNNIAPGSDTFFIVRYTPSAEKEDTAIIRFNYNDGGEFILNVKGTGYVKKPQIKVSNPTTRTVVIDMYDSYGDGWNEGAALRINVNGADIATTRVGLNTNTYSFQVAGSDVVSLYWVAGTYQDENSFVVYYADTPPSPAFTTSNVGPTSWNGSNALIYRVRNTMNGTSNGSLLGSFTVPVVTNTINQHGNYDFGTILTGKTRVVTFNIENTGEADLTFTTVNNNRINLENSTGNHFNVVFQPSSAASVSPGSSTTFTLSFNPQSVGTYFSATVQIKTNSRDNADFSFTIRGNCRNYVIGDEGPGGGIIFYVQGSQFKECSGDLGFSNWNTAMTTAQNYRGGGFSDWYLPNETELLSICIDIHEAGMGNFWDDYYWTSFDNGTTNAAKLDFDYEGDWDVVQKTTLAGIIAVRTFTN